MNLSIISHLAIIPITSQKNVWKFIIKRFCRVLFITHCPLYEHSLGKSLSCASLLGIALLYYFTLRAVWFTELIVFTSLHWLQENSEPNLTHFWQMLQGLLRCILGPSLTLCSIPLSLFPYLLFIYHFFLCDLYFWKLLLTFFQIKEVFQAIFIYWHQCWTAKLFF